jgi:hypothetical protein
VTGLGQTTLGGFSVVETVEESSAAGITGVSGSDKVGSGLGAGFISGVAETSGEGEVVTSGSGEGEVVTSGSGEGVTSTIGLGLTIVCTGNKLGSQSAGIDIEEVLVSSAKEAGLIVAVRRIVERKIERDALFLSYI